ncbi:Cobalamin synthase [Shimia thalassica]|uniref:Adenosylcobinamide-GDP ribazoletransferase n=2 Tax=Shimia thalassica TaxID=1715693 RepID=A0A0P1I5Z3_9RHOB|nr:Cobalamin synthase [Shimia thalassica]
MLLLNLGLLRCLPDRAALTRQEKDADMTKDDTSPLRIGDIATALALLTRLPVRARFERGARAAWAYPLVGIVISGLAALPTWGLLALGLSPVFAALAFLATTVILTGAMHEDGLADCADGFWGGWDRDRRLAIMKDSQIGSYGVIALCLSLATRWAAVVMILSQGDAATQPLVWALPLMVAAVVSRATMPALMSALPHARRSGLSHAQGRASMTTSVIASALAFGVAVGLLGVTGLFLVAMAFVAALACAKIAKAKIEGQTGDVLGATQQIGEVVVLCALTL